MPFPFNVILYIYNIFLSGFHYRFHIFHLDFSKELQNNNKKLNTANIIGDIPQNINWNRCTILWMSWGNDESFWSQQQFKKGLHGQGTI